MKFFFGWLVDQIKNQLKWLVALVSLAFGATTVPHFIHHASRAPSEFGENSADSPAESVGSRAPASIRHRIEGATPQNQRPPVALTPSERNSGSLDEGFHPADERASSPVLISPSMPRQPSEAYRYAPSHGGASRPDEKSVAKSVAKEDHASSDHSVSDVKGEGDVSFAPQSMNNAASSGQVYHPVSGFSGAGIGSRSFAPVGGSAIGAGGGWSVGTQISIQATIGEITTPAIQTGTGIVFISGMEGFAGQVSP